MTDPDPGRRAFAPGRVNLIGDHTDYNEGLALPMAIQLGVEAEYRPAHRPTLVVTTDLDGGRAEIPLAGRPPANLPRWARLAAAIVAEVRPPGGGEMQVRSDLPVGVGLSSSAAFGVALALALGAEPDPFEIARLCQRAEWSIGAPIGLMDPLASMMGSAGAALLVDFASLNTNPVRLPDNAAFVVVHSGTARTVEATEYATRRSQCETAAAILGAPLGHIEAADLDRLDDTLLRRRARHVVSESARVRAFVDAISNRDLPLAGELMVESHRSLRDDFEVSTPELDALVERVSSQPGVLGARMTGAGFGGCAVVLSHTGAELTVSGQAWAIHPSPGARVETI